MKNTLILHGWGGTSNGDWLPWLKNKIEFQADETFVPNLPSTSFPVLEEQLDYLLAYTSDFKEGGNIVGHSLGAQLTLHFIIENNIKNLNVVLVAPSYNNIMDDTAEEEFGGSVNILKPYFNTKINFSKLAKLGTKITVLLSDNDPLIKLESAKKFYSQAENVEFKVLNNRGHFNEPELEEILEFLD